MPKTCYECPLLTKQKAEHFSKLLLVITGWGTSQEKKLNFDSCGLTCKTGSFIALWTMDLKQCVRRISKGTKLIFLGADGTSSNVNLID